MDAFYASVEQRDQPALRGKPVVVGWDARRGVVCAASYEARAFGVRSAMPVAKAKRLCPHAVFVPPDFARYRTVSRQIGTLFRQYTPLVEPLSLDEAYLDVTDNRRGLPTATLAARTLREEIRDTTGLTASAGVAPNKFVAKIASDWRKPDGLFVVQPHEVLDFLGPLAVGVLPGVGHATARTLAELGVERIAALRDVPLAVLVKRLGRQGARLHELAFGIDERPVNPSRPRRSLSVEETFDGDLPLPALLQPLTRMLDEAWTAVQKHALQPRTLVIKLKSSDFELATRSATPPMPPTGLAELQPLLEQLLARFPDAPRYRLAGVGLGNFIEEDAQQPGLAFELFPDEIEGDDQSLI